MASEQPVKLSEKSKPRILGDELVKRIATVTMKAITINITSNEYIHRTITYTEEPKFIDEYQEWYEWTLEQERGFKVDKTNVHTCTDKPLVLKLKDTMYGGKFTFHVVARETKHGLVTENYKFSVRAELSKSEMESFLQNILERVNPDKKKPAFFYRNFTNEDEDRIKDTNNGYFEMTLKLKSGHRSSPLYRKLDNVTYLSCTLCKLNDKDRGNGIIQLEYLPKGFKFPLMSPFGDLRAAYKPSELLNDNSVLFLGGMHCYGVKYPRPHYVTAVVCQKGSLSYNICQELGLLELKWDDNPILEWNKKSDKLYCASALYHEDGQDTNQWPHGVWVEIILCDHAVALSNGRRSTCEHKNYGSDHKSSLTCESCHGDASDDDETDDEIEDSHDQSPVKRKSLEKNRNVPEKIKKGE